MIILSEQQKDMDYTHCSSCEVKPDKRGLSKILPYLLGQENTRYTLFGAGLILPAFVFNELLGIQHPVLNILSIGALLLAGKPVFSHVFQVLKNGFHININVLMTIASIGALFVGAYTEAGMVMVLFGIGEALESFAAHQTRSSVYRLMESIPNQAVRIKSNGGIQNRGEIVDVSDLRVGDIILVKPGERIPMDGCVISGESAVNQAVITGESSLVEKSIESDVFAGSLNGEGSLEIEVTNLADNNIASRMVKLVEQAGEKRTNSQRIIDRFAQYYTPAVVILAALIIFIPTMVFGQPLFNEGSTIHGWLYRGLALLVVACPCALVISTPVSTISALSNAARNGVLIKGGIHLETLSQVKAIAFDKTGTLTEGKPSVLDVRNTFQRNVHAEHVEIVNPRWTPEDGLCNDCLVALASTVENRSEHPLARAVVDESERRGVDNRFPVAEKVMALRGHGINGQVSGHDVFIGSHNYFEQHIPHTNEECNTASLDSISGYTPLMIGFDGNYIGTIIVGDVIRQGSQEALTMLKEQGMEALVMLTGDNQQAAQTIGQQVGVTRVMAELLPEEKVKAIESLRLEYGKVAMVGDGINDTPALATSDVSVAIGGVLGGTGQAMETADIILVNGNLFKIPYLIKLSQAVLHKIKINITLSLLVKLIFINLVLFGLGTMWMAILADTGLTLLVVLNSMQLLKRPGIPTQMTEVQRFIS